MATASTQIRSVAKNTDGTVLQIPEKSAFRYTADLKKEDGSALGSGDVSALTLTLYNLDAALTLINGVNGTNILNIGRGTLSAGGALVVVLDALDLALVDATKESEKHIALITATYAAGARFMRHEIEHTVVNLQKVS
ncbi:MAG TPA: hypothetical protein VKA83_09345 [Methylomirabilota bacterium]|nr:hypothetical protein [Methylomirabilota bacterium]